MLEYDIILWLAHLLDALLRLANLTKLSKGDVGRVGDDDDFVVLLSLEH